MAKIIDKNRTELEKYTTELIAKLIAESKIKSSIPPQDNYNDNNKNENDETNESRKNTMPDNIFISRNILDVIGLKISLDNCLANIIAKNRTEISTMPKAELQTWYDKINKKLNKISRNIFKTIDRLLMLANTILNVKREESGISNVYLWLVRRISCIFVSNVNTVQGRRKPCLPYRSFFKNSFHYTDFGYKINFCVSQVDSKPKS